MVIEKKGKRLQGNYHPPKEQITEKASYFISTYGHIYFIQKWTFSVQQSHVEVNKAVKSWTLKQKIQSSVPVKLGTSRRSMRFCDNL